MKHNQTLFNACGRGVSREQFPPSGRASRANRSRFYGRLALLLAILILVGSSQFPTADAQNTRTRVQSDLAQTFMNHEDLFLDPRAVAEQVRVSGRISLVSSEHSFELKLQPNDLRAANYRAEQTDVDGVRRARHPCSCPSRS